MPKLCILVVNFSKAFLRLQNSNILLHKNGRSSFPVISLRSYQTFNRSTLTPQHFQLLIFSYNFGQLLPLLANPGYYLGSLYKLDNATSTDVHVTHKLYCKRGPFD